MFKKIIKLKTIKKLNFTPHKISTQTRPLTPVQREQKGKN
jgi:hypothetical protein